MKTFKTYTTCLIWVTCSFAQLLKAQENYGEIRGRIKNTDLEAVPYATVKILQGNLLVGGTQSDEGGYYKYKPLTPGSYEVVVMEPGHMTQQINKVTVISGDATYLDVKLSANTLGTITVTAKPIDYTQSGVDRSMYTFTSIDGKELSHMAGYSSGDVKGIISSLVSDVVEGPGGALYFRGGRDGASASYVDGVKTYALTNVPGLAIENLTIFSGGVPAMYGDVMSGVVFITTKSYFSGIREKNIRNAQYRQEREEMKRRQQGEEDEQDRLKEIEAEKAKNRPKQ